MKCLKRFAAAAIVLALGTAGRADDKPAPKAVTDAEFVIKAASGGMFEVESSKLAKEMATSDDVKKLADMMIKDHEMANKQLMAVAKVAGVGLPVKMLEADEKMLYKVKAAKGANFDKTYLDAQLMAHKEAVALFAGAAKSVSDPGLKSFAEKTLPTLKMHLEHVEKHAKGDHKDYKDKPAKDTDK